MQTKRMGMVAVLVAGVWLAGCATGTGRQAPEQGEEGRAPAQTAPGPGERGVPGSGADTEGAREGRAPGADLLPGTAADADLLAKRRVHFAFDSSALDQENLKIVQAHARYLAANANLRVTLEGHADERGTREYNIALGERRAQTVERAMRLLGVSGDRITTTSYGEEKPLVPDSNESAWALNRRVEIIYQ